MCKSNLILQMNDRRAPIVILADDCWLSFFTVPVFRSNILPLKAQEAEKLTFLFFHLEKAFYVLQYPCCCSPKWRAAPWAFLCRLGGADHKEKIPAIQTATG